MANSNKNLNLFPNNFYVIPVYVVSFVANDALIITINEKYPNKPEPTT